MSVQKDIWQQGVPFLLLFILAYVVFANTFGNAWTYDDFPVIVENPDVKSLTGFLADSYPDRPLRELTYLLDHSLFGLKPAGWHIQQIFWHGLNACLVFVLGCQLRLTRWASLIAALLFLLHPLQVEVVANLSHRKDSLALAGSLSAILCYLRFLNVGHRKILWLLAAFCCFLMALYAKQTAVVVPLICLSYEALMLPREQRFFVRKPWLLAGLVGAAFVVAGWWWQSAGGEQMLTSSMQVTLASKNNYFEPVTFTIYYLTVLKSWVFMGLRMVWPVDLALEYTFPVASGLFDLWCVVGYFLLTVVMITVIVGVRRSPVVSWLIVAALLLFLPTANIWPLTYLAADRYLYAPLAFVALLVGYVLMSVRLPRSLLIAVSATVLLVLSILTWQQNSVWKSPQTLWLQATKVSPESSFALNNLGNLALQDGAVSQAESYYKRSVDVNPFNPTAHYNLGALAESRKDLKAALTHYRAFANLKNPMFAKQLENLRSRLQGRYGIRL